MIEQTQAVAGGKYRSVLLSDYSMLLVIAIWGANSSLVKLALFQIQPLAFNAFRFFIASILLTLILQLCEGSIGPPSGYFWKIVGLGFVGNTLYQLFFILGLSITTASNSSLIIATT